MIDFNTLDLSPPDPERPHIRYQDETYVRCYREPSARFLSMWDASDLQAEERWWPGVVWWWFLLHLDRIGQMVVGQPQQVGLAAKLKIPVHVAEVCLSAWLKAGMLTLAGHKREEIWCPQYLLAQYTPQTDAARKRLQREREHAFKQATELGAPIELIELLSRDVTRQDEGGRPRTNGHEKSPSASASASAYDPDLGSIRGGGSQGGGGNPLPTSPGKSRKGLRANGENPRALAAGANRAPPASVHKGGATLRCPGCDQHVRYDVERFDPVRDADGLALALLELKTGAVVALPDHKCREPKATLAALKQAAAIHNHKPRRAAGGKR